MKVYLMNISSINPDDRKWYKYLSQRRIEKVERLKKPLQKSQSIGAELLLRRAVNEITGKNHNVQWDTDKNGKLYLTEHDGIYVNLSHSGNYTVCAVSDKQVGVDIQYCRECDVKMAKRFFAADETKFIDESADKNTAFFEIWTKKESFLKTVGKGITVPLNSFAVVGETINFEGMIYRFKEYSVPENNYKLFACFLL